MRRYTIRYHYGSYRGTETVVMGDDEEGSPVDVMWERLRRGGHLTLGMASRSAAIIGEEEVGDDDDA